MTTWRRVAVAVTAAAMVLGAFGAGLGSAQEPDPGTPSTSVPSGSPPAGEQEVHSWALAPAGSEDTSAAGNRPFLSYEVAPGSEVQDAVTVFNYGNTQLTFRVYATDAVNNQEGGFDPLPGDKESTDVGTWVTLSQEYVTVAPRTQVTMPLTVKVPADARPGDHAGAILASSQAAGTGPDGKTVNVDRRTGSRIYLRVAGALAPELAVESITTTYAPAANPLGGAADVTYTVHNRGNVRMGGKHSVMVSGPLGLATKRSKAVDLPELLPGESLEFTEHFEDVPASVVALAEVRLEPKAVNAGDEGTPTTTRRAMALAPPISIVLLLFALWLTLRSVGAYRRHRRSEIRPEPQLS